MDDSISTVTTNQRSSKPRNTSKANGTNTSQGSVTTASRQDNSISSIRDSKLQSQINREVSLISNSEKELFTYKEDEDKARDLIQRRAIYNWTGNKDVFNSYLPYRNSIMGNPKELKRYDGLVEKIQKNTDMAFMSNPDGAQPTMYEMEPAASYMFAASIVDVFHNRPDLIDKVLNRPEGLKFAMWNNLPRAGAGGGFADTNAILSGNFGMWGGIFRTDDQYNMPVHEFAHAIDAEGSYKNYEMDGTFSEMNDDQKTKFIEARDNISKRSNNYWNSPERSEGRPEHFGQSIDEGSGLRGYAFSNNGDFLAVSLEAFHEDPEGLQKASPMLYDVYKEFLKFDPLELRKNDNDNSEDKKDN